VEREREPEIDYLQRVEGLAHEVVEVAARQGWLAFGVEGEQAEDALHRAVNVLATNLRMMHFDGDGCLDHD